MLNNRLLFIIIGLITGVTSCNSNSTFSSYKSLPNQWHKDSVVSFNFKAPDTLQHYNLFINLRNNNNYFYNNLFLIVELNYPNGKVITDTLEYKMAATNGELLGKGFSDIKENKLWYKGYDKPFTFTETGNYITRISHAMRQQGKVNGITSLKGITEIGFSIEAVKK